MHWIRMAILLNMKIQPKSIQPRQGNLSENTINVCLSSWAAWPLHWATVAGVGMHYTDTDKFYRVEHSPSWLVGRSLQSKLRTACQKPSILHCSFTLVRTGAGWLTDWLNDWMTECLIIWMAELLSDWMTELMNVWMAELLNGWKADWLNCWMAECLNGWMAK